VLISSRTPLRVSFVGGGTDYPEYYLRHRGAVVGMAISKYVYISALRLDSFLEYKYRLSYSKLETADVPDAITHPVVREVLRHYAVGDGLDINVIADLPARSGLGSSSSFTVGLVHLIATLQQRRMTKLDLAREAVYVERDLLCENVGVQDQFHAAFGGINRFDFSDGRVRISPIQIRDECLRYLTDSLVLVYTGIRRLASETLEEQITATAEQKLDDELEHLLQLTDDTVSVLECDDPRRMVGDLGRMLHEGWMTKRQLSSRVSTPEIDSLYAAALEGGAQGGKLCGAGSGGFLLLAVLPENRPRLTDTLGRDRLVSIGVDTQGSTILYG
jgi:D-glycero-alpha-D-manno-heptose-7-phosphate kinase